MRHRGGAEGGVDGGPVAVLPRAAAHLEGALADQQVMVGRRHVEAALLESLAVLGQLAAEAAVAAEMGEQHLAGALGGHVLHHEQRRRQAAGQLADK